MIVAIFPDASRMHVVLLRPVTLQLRHLDAFLRSALSVTRSSMMPTAGTRDLPALHTSPRSLGALCGGELTGIACTSVMRR